MYKRTERLWGRGGCLALKPSFFGGFHTISAEMSQFSQVCAFTAQTVWKRRASGHPVYGEAIFNGRMP